MCTILLAYSNVECHFFQLIIQQCIQSYIFKVKSYSNCDRWSKFTNGVSPNNPNNKISPLDIMVRVRPPQATPNIDTNIKCMNE